MRFAKPAFFVLVAALTVPLGCDWAPGSTLSFSQSVRTWLSIDSGECLAVGRYTFLRDMQSGPFEAKASVRMETEDKQDMEFLPRNFDINYKLNGSLYYQQAFELNKGKGSFREFQPQYWNFEMDDVLTYEICAGGGGTIPTYTKIGVKFDYKFDKYEIK